MENQESICMSEYSYKDNLLYTSKDSEVYKATNKHHKGSQVFAFKGYPENWLTDPVKQKKLMQQLNSLWKLHGRDNILQIISQHSRDKKVFIITEYCQFGTLAQEIKKEGQFNEEKAVVYIKQIVKGYQAIFQSQIIHRNLEPSSILNAGLDLKIADFSDSIKASEIELVTLREEMVGNVHFQPFEVLTSYRYTVRSDVYSIGAILFCMIKGKPPYQGTKSEILAAMKNNTIAAEIASITNKKVQIFLEKTLSTSEEKRMTVEELFSFDFQIVPQLNRLKLFTFDDREDQPSVSHFYQPSFDHQPSQKQKKEDPIKLLFRNFDSSDKKLSFVDLKMSDDLDLSRYYKDKEISIFIPTKLDMTTSQNLVDESLLIKNLDLEKVQSMQKRPSEGLPLRKKAGTNKEISNNIYSDLLKSQTLNRSKRLNQTAKELPIISEKQIQKESNEQPPKIELNNVRMTSLEERQPSINVIACRTEEEIVPPLEFKEKPTQQPYNQIQNKSAFLKNKPSTDRSNQDKGLITLRGRQNVIGSMGVNEHKDSLIAGWLISQIDMFRFLNRVLFKLKKVEKNDHTELFTLIVRFKEQLLSDVKSLKCLQPIDAQSFKKSSQYNKILEIVQAYNPNPQPKPQFQGYNLLNKQILATIHTLFTELTSCNEFKEDLIKVIDYLITFWQLVKLIKKNDAQYFHNRSKIQEILDSKESRLTVGHLFKLYDRMKILKLI